MYSLDLKKCPFSALRAEMIQLTQNFESKMNFSTKAICLAIRVGQVWRMSRANGKRSLPSGRSNIVP